MKNNKSAQSYHSLIRSSSVFRYDNKILIHYCLTNKASLFFSVSRGFGSAVIRNLFKRRIRMLSRGFVVKGGRLLGLAVRPLRPNLSFDDLSHCFLALKKNINKEVS